MAHSKTTSLTAIRAKIVTVVRLAVYIIDWLHECPRIAIVGVLVRMPSTGSHVASATAATGSIEAAGAPDHHISVDTY